MIETRSRVLRFILPLYVAAATALGFVDYQIRSYPTLAFEEYSPSVIAGQADAPGRYRVLAPYAYEGLRRVTGLAPANAWVLFRWMALGVFLAASHLYLTTWFDDRAAAAGNFLALALLPLTFTNSWAHPDHFTELALFTAACACIARQWTTAALALIALNALNRETSAFLVLLFWLAGPTGRYAWRVRVAAAGIWVAIYVALRAWLGFATYDAWQGLRNFQWLLPMAGEYPPYLRIRGWFFLVLLAPLWWPVLATWSRQTRFSRAAAGVVAPAFLLTAWLFSSVIEARIFTPLIPLLLPGVLSAMGAPAPRIPSTGRL